MKAGRLRGLTFAVGVLKRRGKFYGTDRERWWGVGMREIYLSFPLMFRQAEAEAPGAARSARPRPRPLWGPHPKTARH